MHKKDAELGAVAGAAAGGLLGTTTAAMLHILSDVSQIGNMVKKKLAGEKLTSSDFNVIIHQCKEACKHYKKYIDELKRKIDSE